MKLTENQMYALAAIVVGGVLLMYYRKANPMPDKTVWSEDPSKNIYPSTPPATSNSKTPTELQTTYGSALI